MPEMVPRGSLKALPLPAEIPALSRTSPLLVLGDMDAVSHGLAEGTAGDRASDAYVGAVLGQVRISAGAFGPITRIRLAASSATARHHLDLVMRSANNVWSIRQGLDGADHALVEELEDLAAARLAPRNHKHAPRDAGLVVLLAQDHIYGPAVHQLRLLGVPTWVLQPGRYIAAELYKAATAVTVLSQGSQLEPGPLRVPEPCRLRMSGVSCSRAG
jgi:hypothetical protein